MAYDNLIVATDNNHIGSITLNQPDRLNTFTTPMANELHLALRQLEDDDNVRVILIKGEGKAFCAGIDLNELEGKSPLEYKAWIERMERPFVTISEMKTPTIAQVQGVAAANGMGLAVSADLTIAAEHCKMGLTAINVGLNCVGPVIPVSKIVGRKNALELLLYGNLIKAEEAFRLGLVNHIVPADKLEEAAYNWAKELAQKSPLAVQIAKTAFYRAEDMGYQQQFDSMNDAFARLCTTEDAQEGVNAFLEKRRPVWKMR